MIIIEYWRNDDFFIDKGQSVESIAHTCFYIQENLLTPSRSEISLAEALLLLYTELDGMYFYQNTCMIAKKYTEIHHDEVHRLHNKTGPALVFENNLKIYALHGNIIDSSIIEKPESITVEQINNENNTELQRIMIEIFGWDRFAKESKTSLIHKDQYGELYGPNSYTALFVKVINGSPEPDGSFREYILPVSQYCEPLPLDSKKELGSPQALTALNAVASTYGMTGSKYKKLLEVRT